MRPSFQPRLSRGNSVLNCLAAGVPNFRFAAALALAADAVVSAKTNQFGSVANLHTTQLGSEIREIDVARMLIGRVDADIAARFATAVIVGDRAAAPGRRESASCGKASILHAVAKRRVHHQRLEG